MAARNISHRDFHADAFFEATVAIRNNDIKTLQRLVNTRLCDYRVQYSECRSKIIFLSIELGNLEITKILLDAGFDRDYYNTSGEIFRRIFSPLYAAFEIKNREIRSQMLKLLVESGVNPEKENLYSESCIYRAVELGDREMVKFLCEAGANINYSNMKCIKDTFGYRTVAKGYSPLHAAVSKLDGDDRVEMVTLLIELGADIDAEEIDSLETPLHLIAVHKSKSCETLKLLLDAGARLNCLDKEGSSPLARAAYYGDIELMKIMIAAGANVNFSKKCASSPLYNAVSAYHSDAVQLLLENGANPHVMDEDNILRFASYLDEVGMSKLTEYIDILKILFAYGANPQCTNIESQIPFRSVLVSGTIEAMHLFFDNGITLENSGVSHNLHCAAENRSKDILEYLLNTHLYDVNEIEHYDHKCYTALFVAVDNCQSHNVELLIKWGADVNIPHVDGSRKSKKVVSPLYQAIGRADCKSVDLLLACGANMNADTGFGVSNTISSIFVHDEGYHETLASLTAEVALLKSRGYSNADEKNIIMREFANLSPELEEQCFAELKKLKNIIFYDTCTLYDLLRGKDVTRYVKNSKVADDFESLRVVDYFPVYGNRIMGCYSLAKAKRAFMDEASKRLNALLKFRFCNHDNIFHDITSQLSFNDLHNLCNV